MPRSRGPSCVAGIAGAALAAEILIAGRVVGPIAGLGPLVWTALLGPSLAGSNAGCAAAGRRSERALSAPALAKILAAASI